jgi:putative FmdB family regulatory protein
MCIMPTYEYHCDACSNHFDEFQGINEPALKKCPKCKKSKLRRIFGAGAAVIFKGSGFYETDYRSESYKAAAKADSEKAGGNDKKDGSDKSGGSEKSGDKGKSETTSSDAKTPAKAAKTKPAKSND